MERISKSHLKFQQMKEYLKTNHYKDITVSDDLQVLKIALENNLEIELLLYDFEENYKTETKELLDKLLKVSKESYEISKASYSTLSLKENHAGIIAAIKLKKYNFDDFKKMDFITVLDRLEIPGNIGTIYRTLDSCKCDGVILVDSVSKINNEKITASSRGCNLIIPTLELTYEEAKSFLKDNFTIYLGEPILGLDYQTYDYNGKVALIVGNERFGINPDWYNQESKKVFIPMEGNQNSLNVGVAASILAYEIYMKKHYKKGH